MKTIILGDIHGRTIWKDIINQESFDRLIFIGDYIDTYESISGEQQLANLLDIIQYKKDNSDKVILLLGNHDYHYLPNINEQYSGYQEWQKWNFEKVLKDNLNLFQMCYQIPNTNIICSHAGISKTWCYNNNINKEFLDNDNGESIIKSINDLFIYKPLSFRFTGFDMYGDSIESSPIWIREKSLSKDKLSGFTQIVGHTTKHNLRQMGRWISNHDKFKVDDENIWMIDTLGTSKEYLIVNDKEIQVKQFKDKTDE